MQPSRRAVLSVFPSLAALSVFPAGSLLPRRACAAPRPVLGIWDDAAPGADGPLPRVDPASPRGGTLRTGAVGTFDSFNPFAPRGVKAALLSLTYDRLGESVSGDEFIIRGQIAETFDTAPDRRSMTVRLREGVTFSDGSPVTAADVVWSFEALMRDASPTFRSYWREVEGAKALDGRTVRFTFRTDGNRELPLITAQIPVLPSRWWQGRNLGDPLKTPMPGTGPYRIADRRLGERLVLERVRDWWGDGLPANAGRWNFDRIEVEYYRDWTVMREAFFAGNMDYYIERTIKDWKMGYDVPAVRSGAIARAEVRTQSAFGFSGIFMNTRRPVLADRRVREALSLMFDFEAVNRTVFFGAYDRCMSYFTGTRFEAADPMTPREREILSGLPGITPEVVNIYEKLPDLGAAAGNPRARLRRALRLMQAADWKLGKGVLRNAAGEPFRLTMLLSSASIQRVLSRWANDLRQLGAELELTLVDQTQYVNRLRHYDFDLVLATARQSVNPGNEQQYFWGSRAAGEPGTRNYSGIRDPAVDRLIESIARPASREDLLAHVRVLDRLLRCGHYAVPGWLSRTSRIAWWRDRIEPPRGRVPEGDVIDVYSWHAAGEGQG
ncbi:extracellular solute-binding protein [Sutterella sp.]|uniref:extracellular solute-binding protein n=1 Tax=Sutterella sp. TaxID=1981025 RepID=UPI0026E05C2A|nr:extracellular solute-binding protein [Sutterella sp.]MDO5531792.1 extracellular solute-binding protein [Sutterella sp.]